MNEPHSKRIAIIGGGITGLAAAFRLNELQPSWKVTLLEAQDRLGGILGTHHQDGFLIEQSADNFLAGPNMPYAEALCRRAGFADQLLETDKRYRKALVLSGGKLYPVPDGFQLMTPSKAWPILTSGLLSPAGKLRLLRERWIPPRTDDADESLASFALRRLGREAYEKLVQPLISGIYTADPEQLSMQAALPQFVQMERKFGSLTKAATSGSKQAQTNAADSGARYSQFLGPKLGMQSLIDHLAKTIAFEQCLTNSPVSALRRQDVADAANGGSWRIESPQVQDAFDGVILTTSANAASKLLQPVKSSVAESLAAVTHASSTVVVLAFPTSAFPEPLQSFGCVIPAAERRQILAISFTSMKFPSRAPDGWHMLRIFLGGALQPELAKLSDEESVHIATQEARQILQLQGEPQVLKVVRWADTMPQYHVGHPNRMATLQQQLAELPGLEIAGNAFAGVGIPQCVKSGEDAAERLVQTLTGSG